MRGLLVARAQELTTRVAALVTSLGVALTALGWLVADTHGRNAFS